MKSMTMAASILAIFMALSPVQSANITLDGKTEFQTIEGFGAYGSIYPSHQQSASPVWTEEFVNLIVNNMGATALRIQIPPAFEINNDNNDPHNLDLSKFNLSTYKNDKCHYRIRQIDKEAPFWKAIEEAGQANGDGMKVIATIWSPPAWMKTIGCVTGTDKTWNRVDPAKYEELAEYCEAFVKIYKRETGYDLYGLGFANEPDFAQTFQSAVYSDVQYAEALGVIRNRFDSKGINTKIYGPEDMTFAVTGRYGRGLYIVGAADQPMSDLDAFATHGYSDGVNSSPTSSAPRDWSNIYTFVSRTVPMPIWMTETSGWPGSGWDAAFHGGLAFGIALYYGNVSLWTHWTWDSDDLITGGKKGGPGFDMYKQYWKYIRPGAIRIASTTTNDQVLPIAFNHKKNKTLTIVIVNSGSATSANISGVNIPGSFTAYQSSNGALSKSLNTVNASSVNLPAKSITTLVATNYNESGPETGNVIKSTYPYLQQRRRIHSGFATEFYTLTGRKLAPSAPSQRGTRGIYIAIDPATKATGYVTIERNK